MINDAQGSHTHQLLLGLLFIVFILAAQPRVPNTSEGKSGETLAAPFLATRDYRKRLRDEKDSKSHFNVRSIEKWERSVVSIGRHDPGIGKFCWYPHRTGFAVSGRLRRRDGTLVVSADVRTSARVPDRFRVHAYPFAMPPSWYAYPASLSSTGSLSFIGTLSATGITPARLAYWTIASYDRRFPVVLIGFHDGELVHFFTHSVGFGDSRSRIKLARRPPTGIGEFIGAPVFNTDGLVVGVFSPRYHIPTYVTSTALRACLDQR